MPARTLVWSSDHMFMLAWRSPGGKTGTDLHTCTCPANSRVFTCLIHHSLPEITPFVPILTSQAKRNKNEAINPRFHYVHVHASINLRQHVRHFWSHLATQKEETDSAVRSCSATGLIWFDLFRPWKETEQWCISPCVQLSPLCGSVWFFAN